MKRRQFMVTSASLALSSALHAKHLTTFEKQFEPVRATIEAVQLHMFPTRSLFPSANKMKMTPFLYETIMHATYDKDIRLFVIEGAEELIARENGKFTQYSAKKKEKALRDFEETLYGKNWLGRIMTLSMEALFSDPIYGSNIKEEGWKSIDAYGGFPRAATRYLA